MSTKNRFSTIVLKSIAGVSALKGEETGIASVATIKPGYLIKQHTDNSLILHPTAGGYAEIIVACEGLEGKDVTTAYASGDEVPYHVCLPGDELALWLTTSQTIAIDDKLVSNGDGLVAETDGTDQYILFRAQEAVTTTGAAKQIKARCIGCIYLKA